MHMTHGIRCTARRDKNGKKYNKINNLWILEKLANLS